MKIFLIVYTYGVLFSSGEILSVQVTPVNSMTVCKELASKVKSSHTGYGREPVTAKCLQVKE